MINSVLLVLYNLIRFRLKRIFAPHRLGIHYIQRISPRASIKVFDQGRVKVGRNCEFAAGCDFQVHSDGVLTIGGGVYFNRYCMISAHQKVSIGEHCIFGPGVKIFDNNHKFNAEHGVVSGLSTDDIVIGNNCWIASDVVILKGVHIGDNSVIGAGCIIYKDIPAKSVVKNKQDLQIEPL